MTEASQIEEMKRYLFGEMSGEESEIIEERIFDDTDFFDELTDLENDLVDRFVCKKLLGEDLARFELSLSKIPERREKIANARALQTIIAEEKSKSIAVVAVPSFWEKISSFFNLQIPTLKLAAGALAILLVCAAAFLLYRNWQARNEFADIERQKQQRIELEEKENRLKDDDEEIKRLELEEERLKNQENNNPTENSNIDSTENPIQPNQEKELRKQIEEKKNQREERRKQIEEDRKKLVVPPTQRKEVKPQNEVLAVSILSFRGDFNPTAKIDKINGEQKIILTVPVPLDKNYESIEVRSINGTDKKPIPEGAKFIVFYLPPNDTPIDVQVTERNSNGDSKSIGRFRLEVKKTKK